MKKEKLALFFLILCLCGFFLINSSLLRDTIHIVSTNVLSPIGLELNLKIATDTIDGILGILVAGQLTIVTILLPVTFVVAQLIGEYQSTCETASIIHNKDREWRVLTILACILIELILISINDIVKFSSTSNESTIYFIYILIFSIIAITFYEFWKYLSDLKQKMDVKQNVRDYINKVVDGNKKGYYDFNIQPILDIFNKLVTNKESTTLEECLKVIRDRISKECDNSYNWHYNIKRGSPLQLLQSLKKGYNSKKISFKVNTLKKFPYIGNSLSFIDISGDFFTAVTLLKKNRTPKNTQESSLSRDELLPLNTERSLLYLSKYLDTNEHKSQIFDKKRFHDTIVLFFRTHREFLLIAKEEKFEKGFIIILESIQLFLDDMELLRDRLESEKSDEKDILNLPEIYNEIYEKYSDILKFANEEATNSEMVNAVIAIAWGKGKLWEIQNKHKITTVNYSTEFVKLLDESGQCLEVGFFDAANAILHVTIYYSRIILETFSNEERENFVSKINLKLDGLFGKIDEKVQQKSLLNKTENSLTYLNSLKSCRKNLMLYLQNDQIQKNPYDTYEEINNTIKNYFKSFQNSIGSSYLPYIKLLRIQSDYYYVLSDYTQSIQQLEHAKDIISHKYGTDSLQLAKILNHLSRVYLDKGDVKNSIELCNQASLIRLHCDCPYLSSELAASLINYSLISRFKGETKQALELLKTVQDIREKLADEKNRIAANIFESTIKMDNVDLTESKELIGKAIKDLNNGGLSHEPIYIGALHQEAIINCDLAIKYRETEKFKESPKLFKAAKINVERATQLAKFTFGEKSTDYNALLVTHLNILYEENDPSYSEVIDKIFLELKNNCKCINDKKNKIKFCNIEARKILYDGKFSDAFEIFCKNHQSLYEIYPENSTYLLASRLNIANALHCYIKVFKNLEEVDQISRFTFELYRYIQKIAQNEGYMLFDKGCQKNIEELNKIIPEQKYYYYSRISEHDIRTLLEKMAQEPDREKIDNCEIRKYYNKLFRFNYNLELLPYSHNFSEHVFLYQLTYF